MASSPFAATSLPTLCNDYSAYCPRISKHILLEEDKEQEEDEEQEENEEQEEDEEQEADEEEEEQEEQEENEEQEEDAVLFSPFEDLMELVSEFQKSGAQWDGLKDVLHERHLDPKQVLLNLQDLLSMIDLECTLTQIELGWHMVRLRNRIMPALRHARSLSQKYSQAVKALERCNCPSTSVNPTRSQTQSHLIRLRKKHQRSLRDYKSYAVIGKEYGANLISLL